MNFKSQCLLLYSPRQIWYFYMGVFDQGQRGLQVASEKITTDCQVLVNDQNDLIHTFVKTNFCAHKCFFQELFPQLNRTSTLCQFAHRKS